MIGSKIWRTFETVENIC